MGKHILTPWVLSEVRGRRSLVKLLAIGWYAAHTLEWLQVHLLLPLAGRFFFLARVLHSTHLRQRVARQNTDQHG